MCDLIVLSHSSILIISFLCCTAVGTSSMTYGDNEKYECFNGSLGYVAATPNGPPLHPCASSPTDKSCDTCCRVMHSGATHNFLSHLGPISPQSHTRTLYSDFQNPRCWCCLRISTDKYPDYNVPWI